MTRPNYVSYYSGRHQGQYAQTEVPFANGRSLPISSCSRDITRDFQTIATTGDSGAVSTAHRPCAERNIHISENWMKRPRLKEGPQHCGTLDVVRLRRPSATPQVLGLAILMLVFQVVKERR